MWTCTSSSSPLSVCQFSSQPACVVMVFPHPNLVLYFIYGFICGWQQRRQVKNCSVKRPLPLLLQRGRLRQSVLKVRLLVLFFCWCQTSPLPALRQEPTSLKQILSLPSRHDMTVHIISPMHVCVCARGLCTSDIQFWPLVCSTTLTFAHPDLLHFRKNNLFISFFFNFSLRGGCSLIPVCN